MTRRPTCSPRGRRSLRLQASRPGAAKPLLDYWSGADLCRGGKRRLKPAFGSAAAAAFGRKASSASGGRTKEKRNEWATKHRSCTVPVKPLVREFQSPSVLRNSANDV